MRDTALMGAPYPLDHHKHGHAKRTASRPAVGVESPGRRRKPLRHREVTLWRPCRPAERTTVVDGGDRWGPAGGAGGGSGHPPPACRAGAKPRELRGAAASAAAQRQQHLPTQLATPRQSQPFDRLRANGPCSGAVAYVLRPFRAYLASPSPRQPGRQRAQTRACCGSPGWRPLPAHDKQSTDH